MQKQLFTIIDKLNALLETAQGYADSENEKTADKYADIPSHIESAIEAIQEAADLLGD